MKITRYRMDTYEEEIPHSLEGFNNWEFSSGTVTVIDFKVFARIIKSVIVKQLPEGIDLVDFYTEHYDLGGFVQRGKKYAYFSISDVRFFPGDWYKNILIRTATSNKDYTGGANHYTTLDTFGRDIESLLLD